MLRPLYSVLVGLHPPAFRHAYGPEMLSIFDHTPACHRAVLLGDAAVSLLRQWLLRPEFHQPERRTPTTAAGPTMFRVLNDDPRLTPRQWIGGAALSLLGWTVAALFMGHATIHAVALSAGPSESSAERRRLAVYFDSIRVLNALDLNRDFGISPTEIANAPWALQSLDQNHDGRLDRDECVLFSSGLSPVLDPMTLHPTLAALDANHDGVISALEIANAPAALAALDKNRDGVLTAAELLPVRNP